MICQFIFISYKIVSPLSAKLEGMGKGNEWNMEKKKDYRERRKRTKNEIVAWNKFSAA